MLLASAAALGVGLIALPASAAAAPPVVPTCTFPNTRGQRFLRHDRDHRGRRADRAAFEPIRLGVRVRSEFTPATSETTSVNLKFDDDIALNLAGSRPVPRRS